MDFKNAAKKWQKGFYFLDNFILIGGIKLSPLRGGYLSWVVNVSTDNPKILHRSKREFFQLNYLLNNFYL